MFTGFYDFYIKREIRFPAILKPKLQTKVKQIHKNINYKFQHNIRKIRFIIYNIYLQFLDNLIKLSFNKLDQVA